jgi:hypothetical protein
MDKKNAQFSKNADQLNKAWAKITAKAWIDPAFKEKLLKNPNEVLRSYGVETQGVNFKVHESDSKNWHLMLPPVPENVQSLDEADLMKLSGGMASCSCHENL